MAAGLRVVAGLRVTAGLRVVAAGLTVCGSRAKSGGRAKSTWQQGQELWHSKSGSRARSVGRSKSGESSAMQCVWTGCSQTGDPPEGGGEAGVNVNR